MKIQWFNLIAAVGFLYFMIEGLKGNQLHLFSQIIVMGALSTLMFLNSIQRVNPKGTYEVTKAIKILRANNSPDRVLYLVANSNSKGRSQEEAEAIQSLRRKTTPLELAKILLEK